MSEETNHSGSDKPAVPSEAKVKHIVRHVCAEGKTCTCSMLALEPDEDCPVHGAGPYPPRCGKCGRFIKRPNPTIQGRADCGPYPASGCSVSDGPEKL